ncbi:MAG: hypothetical protein AB7K09_05105 [Planctomycetota bacterium]
MTTPGTTAIPASNLLWGKLVPDRIREAAKSRGADALLRDLAGVETLCVAGQMVGNGDLVLHSPAGSYQEFAGSFRRTLTRLVLSHNGILAELSDDRFLVLFPRLKDVIDKPIGSGFAFCTELDRECHDLFSAIAHRLYHHPITDDHKPRRYGFSVGIDLGEISWSLHDGMLVVSGPAVTWSRRCMQGDADAVIVNNALRWRMADSSTLEAASAVALYAHHILFREVVLVSDGITFRAYRLARRK